MRNRPYELGLIDGRLGHRPSNGFWFPWSRRSYARGYAEGRAHYLDLTAYWTRRLEELART